MSKTGSRRDPALRLEAFMPYRLSVLSNRLSRTLSRLYADQFDLSIPQWRVLSVLGESPGLCADEICRITEMDKVTVSRSVHSLLKQNRVERQRDVRDGRRARIRLTRKGYGLYRKLIPIALSLEQSLLNGLNTSEKRQLDRLLSKLIELAGQLEREWATAR